MKQSQKIPRKRGTPIREISTKKLIKKYFNTPSETIYF
jgi:hypothetical protein